MRNTIFLIVFTIFVACLVGYTQNYAKNIQNSVEIVAFNEKNAQIKVLTEELERLKSEFKFAHEFEETRCWCVPYQSEGYSEDKLNKKAICDYKEWQSFIDIGEPE